MATSPVEASIEWGIQKVRRSGGAREGGFPGASRILGEFENGVSRRRVGLKPEGKAPVLEGTASVPRLAFGVGASRDWRDTRSLPDAVAVSTRLVLGNATP